MEPEMRHFVIKCVLGVAAIAVALSFCGGIIYAVVDYYGEDDPDENPTPEVMHPEVTGGDILDYFEHANHDGLYVTFVHGANSVSEMDNALADDTIDILEADITLEYYGLENQTTIPIMAHPPVFISDNTLANWFDNVVPSKKGIKMDIKVEEVTPYALNELRLRGSEVNQPVWINADVIKGPNTLSNPIDGAYFIHEVNKAFPNVTLSMGWTTGYRFGFENEEYSWEAMDDMLELAKETSQRITFPIRAALGRNSWHKFLWLLEQEDRFSLTVWSATTDPVSIEDKLYIRDNFDTGRVFYDTGSEFVHDIRNEIEHRTMEKIFYTGGNVLDFFRISDKDAMKVTWAHRANNKDDLEKAIKDDNILMLEADVRLRPDGVPVMAHTSADIPFSDQTLEEWLFRVKNETTKGIKLDVKTTNTLQPSLEILQGMADSLKVPIWFNSDVLRGPNSVSIPVDADNFFQQTKDSFPHATLSPGWTTAYNPIGDNEGYTQDMVQDMYTHCKDSRQAVTFPVRASLVGQSVEQFQWLLNHSNRFSLTIWHSGTEDVNIDDLVKVRNSFKKSKVFYDLPEEMMKDFKAALEMGE